jgi:hypothetical protein
MQARNLTELLSTVSYMKYDKQDQQGKAAFNERFLKGYFLM